jgi:hypothetical protein
MLVKDFFESEGLRHKNLLVTDVVTANFNKIY